MPVLSSSYPMTILNTDTAVNRGMENKKVPWVWPDSFVTGLHVENRSPTTQKDTGHFSTLISVASSSYMKRTQHLTEWNVPPVICFWNDFFLTGPPRTRWQWLCKVTHMKVRASTMITNSREHSKGPHQQLGQLPHFINEQSHSPLLLGLAAFFVLNFCKYIHNIFTPQDVRCSTVQILHQQFSVCVSSTF